MSFVALLAACVLFAAPSQAYMWDAAPVVVPPSAGALPGKEKKASAKLSEQKEKREQKEEPRKEPTKAEPKPEKHETPAEPKTGAAGSGSAKTQSAAAGGGPAGTAAPGGGSLEDAWSDGSKHFDGSTEQEHSSASDAAVVIANSGTGETEPQKAPPAAKGFITAPLPPPGAAVASPPQDAGFWDSWTGAVRRRAGDLWDTVKDRFSGFAGEVRRVLTEMGSAFKDAFMRVWQAPETKSTGTVRTGRLINGIQMPDTPYYKIINRRETWGSKHMILGLMYIGARLTLEGVPTMKIGDISAQNGGQLGGHKSHRKGLDVDIPFYYSKSSKSGYDMASNYRVLHHIYNNPFFTAEMIFVSPRMKRLLLAQAKAAGDSELAGWASGVLHTGEPGHHNHYHVRISAKPKFLDWLQGLF